MRKQLSRLSLVLGLVALPVIHQCGDAAADTPAKEAKKGEAEKSPAQKAADKAKDKETAKDKAEAKKGEAEKSPAQKAADKAKTEPKK
jgi:hypothetical protein